MHCTTCNASGHDEQTPATRRGWAVAEKGTRTTRPSHRWGARPPHGSERLARLPDRDRSHLRHRRARRADRRSPRPRHHHRAPQPRPVGPRRPLPHGQGRGGHGRERTTRRAVLAHPAHEPPETGSSARLRGRRPSRGGVSSRYTRGLPAVWPGADRLMHCPTFCPLLHHVTNKNRTVVAIFGDLPTPRKKVTGDAAAQRGDAVNPTVLSAAISAITAAGITMLVARPKHDLTRSVGVVGVLAGAMGAATTIHYALVDRRLCRVEELGERIVCTERDVLAALID